MEEEVENKEFESGSPLSEKKYITTWHNKWLTSKAGSIDDFIKIYEETAELMKHWKAEGIIIDPDIIASAGDDFAQFCTYDEKIAIKEGFEEEIIEEYCTLKIKGCRNLVIRLSFFLYRESLSFLNSTEHAFIYYYIENYFLVFLDFIAHDLK
ncbi:unnamed protein product, partial [marine sediment metagenome]